MCSIHRMLPACAPRWSHGATNVSHRVSNHKRTIENRLHTKEQQAVQSTLQPSRYSCDISNARHAALPTFLQERTWLEVAMHNARRVHARELLRHVKEHVQDGRRRAIGAEPLLQADTSLKRQKRRKRPPRGAAQLAVCVGTREVQWWQRVLQHGVLVRAQLEVKVCALLEEPAHIVDLLGLFSEQIERHHRHILSREDFCTVCLWLVFACDKPKSFVDL